MMNSVVVILVPAAVAIVGLLIFAMSSKNDPKEIGRILFFCGVFWLVWLLAAHKFEF